MGDRYDEAWLRDHNARIGRIRALAAPTRLIDRDAQTQDPQGPLPATVGDKGMGEDQGASALASRSAPHAERRTQKRTSQTLSAPSPEAAAGGVRSGARTGAGPSARPVIKRPEQALQILTAEFLDWALPPEFRFFHIPNGEKRSPVIAAILKAMGVKPGAADVLILGPPWFGFLWIELKADKGRLTTPQEDWRAWVLSVGQHWALCRSLDDVVAACEDAGIKLLGRPQ